jgi:hypothetical protein
MFLPRVHSVCSVVNVKLTDDARSIVLDRARTRW